MKTKRIIMIIAIILVIVLIGLVGYTHIHCYNWILLIKVAF